MNQTGSVAAVESASPAGGVSTINSSIQATGALSGSVPAENLPAGPISIDLAETVKLALRWNLGPITADDSARAARAERIQALSALLPNI